MRKMTRYLAAALCAAVLLCGICATAYASGESWEDVETSTTEPEQTPAPTPEPTPDPTPKPTATPEPTPAPTPAATPAAKPAASSGTGTAAPAKGGTTGKTTPTAATTPAAGTASQTGTGKAPENGAADDPPEDEAPEGTGGLDWEGLDPSTMNPLTPDGQGSVLDNADDSEGKEFFTVTTEDGSVFYLVIDRQKSGDNVYFLNTVTIADLMALAEGGATITPGGAPEPDPEPTPDVTPEPDPEPERDDGGGINVGMLALAVAVIAVGGGARWYFKVYRPKHQQAAELEDYPDSDGPGPDMEDYGAEPLWGGDDGDGEDGE